MNDYKEYLEKQPDGTYALVLRGDLCKKSDILIPEGAIRARFYPHDPDELEFENAFRQWWHNGNNKWINYGNYSNSLKYSRVVWQREQDEPFLTPECTLNDQYAEIEQAGQAIGGVDATLAERQSTYGNFEDVAFVTENIMSILAKVRPNGLDDLPNTHRMALYMIASKMARIVNGDFNHLDSWHDIGGYSKLIEKLIKGE